MKKIEITIMLPVIFFFLMFELLVPFSFAANVDVTGVWNGTWQGSRSSGRNLYELAQDGTNVTGKGSSWGGDCPGYDYIVKGHVNGNILSFEYSFSNCGSGTMRHQWIVEGNQATGNWVMYLGESVVQNGSTTLTRSINSNYINATAGPNGTITPDGNIQVSAGSNATFIISPNTGYKVADVIVDGVSVGERNTYTFSSVSANHTITATFEKESEFMPLLLLLLND